MAEKDKKVQRSEKSAKGSRNFFQKTGVFFIRTAKRLKNFFTGLKAELKRVIWPDRKRLIQSTATVLAICVIIGIILFAVDTVVGGLLQGIGFYSGGGTTTPTTTTAATTVETTVTTTESDTSTTAAETTAAG